MPTCNECGGFVSKDFVRVFGANDGDVFACPDCSTTTNLVHGAAAET
jgi:hypothetical protein